MSETNRPSPNRLSSDPHGKASDASSFGIPNIDTKIFGVVGNPVRHSRSPHLFNKIFQWKNHNALYLPFQHDDPQAIFTALKILGVSGLSITVPYKESFFHFMDELEPIAKHLKCINTVILRKGKYVGTNTDGMGAIASLEEHEKGAGRTVGEWRNSSITFLGVGGAARGIVLSMFLGSYAEGQPPFTGEITLVARNRERAEALLRDIPYPKKKVIDWNYLRNTKLDSDIVINTTSLGMARSDQPDSVKKSPLEERQISEKSIIFDIVYTPLETTLLKRAQMKGASTIDGLSMFLGQANQQYYHWMGEKLELEDLRKIFFEKG